MLEIIKWDDNTELYEGIVDCESCRKSSGIAYFVEGKFLRYKQTLTSPRGTIWQHKLLDE